jgi:hypothetical protein
MTGYMDKIDWTAAPDWAQWAAIDGDGDVWCYEDKPKLGRGEWYLLGDWRIGFICFTPNSANWRESLRQRPSANPEPDTPKLWRDMTPGEKGALLLAHHEGKVIESRWLGENWTPTCAPEWHLGASYRIRPEPKRETVTRHLSHAGVAYPVTIDVVDGVLQWDTLKPLPKVVK